MHPIESPIHYAHSTSGGTEDWELLKDHLDLVSTLASQFASKFDAEHFGEVLGKWHDLGKYSHEFQGYLKRQNGVDVHVSETTGRIDHATAGAKFADSLNQLPVPVRRALAYCIAGHHAGLANAVEGKKISAIEARLRKKIPTWEPFASKELLQCPVLNLPAQIDHSIRFEWNSNTNTTTKRVQRAGFTWAMFVRMLFSSLVDADFLATEQFMSPQSMADRPRYRTKFSDLDRCLSDYLESLSSARSGRIAELRRSILASCQEAAKLRPGLFSLTVPTGGGKTLASMSFALRHIQANSQLTFDRIVVAIPFTSIIEQTADVFRQVFMPLNESVVLEHHSNVEPERETNLTRLAAQNFDSPIVVTTNVQLFESLFSNRTSRCRKLHNLARSVIILDEAQTLPIELLEPTLLAIRELVRSFGCTVVLCSATQPAVNHSEFFPIGLEDVVEIIPEPRKLYEEMRRTRVHYIGQIDLDDLADRLCQHRQFLCIQNTRPLAAKTFAALCERSGAKASKGVYHLSTFMCPAHRKLILKRIRQRLHEGKRCQVVSTQLIEAGVDVDFPIVYRSLAGLDSIAQAAGRCNREGARDHGDVFVFSLPELPPPGFLRTTAATAQTLLQRFGSDLIHPEAIEHYFQVHYWQNQRAWDSKEILALHIDGVRKGMVDFESIAAAYKMIEDDSIPVLVPFNSEARTYIKRLRSTVPSMHPLTRKDRQKIARYSVPVFSSTVAKFLGSEFETVYDNLFFVLLNESLYGAEIGIDLSKVGEIDSGALVV